MKPSRMLAAGVLVVFAVSPLFMRDIDPNHYEGGRSRDVASGEQRNTSAIAGMLGEFRTALADVLYVKTELYFDGGVAYQPHLSGERLAEQGTVATGSHEGHSHHHGMTEGAGHEEGEDAGTPTMIPTAQGDFRGFIGDLQRQVKPWRDPSLGHQHSDGRELLPWYRVATVVDPHHVVGYAIGGFWLRFRNLPAAFGFVEEGARNNPSSSTLVYTLAQLHLEKARQLNHNQLDAPGPDSLAEFLVARDHYVRAADMAIRRRPPGWVDDHDHPTPGWTDENEDDARGAARMAAMLENRYGDPSKGAAMARRYLSVFGRDKLLEKAAGVPEATSP